jgi:uncharacterized membrane protein YbhN (UPF0104 family)
VHALGLEWGGWIWDLPLVVAASFLARVPGAPAGLGVREAVMTTLLMPVTGPSVAVSAALLLRVAALLSDALMLGLGLVLRVRR